MHMFEFEFEFMITRARAHCMRIYMHADHEAALAAEFARIDIEILHVCT